MALEEMPTVEGEKQKRRRRTAQVVPSDQAPGPLEIRKAVEALTIRNVSASGEITFLQRKAYNAMLQVAQKAAAEDLTYEVPIQLFETLIGMGGSNNREHLKDTLRKLSAMQVEFDYRGGDPEKNRGAWGIANLVAEVYLDETRSKLRFSFPPELKKKMLDPQIYNRIDLQMQNLFTSYSALALYEVVSRYFTAPVKRTFSAHWTEWSVILSGGQKPHKTYREFSKMLNRAVMQTNTHETRFVVTPQVSMRGRKVDQLWFVLEPVAQSSLPLEGAPVLVSDTLHKRLASLGVSDLEIRDLAVEHDEEYLLAQAEYTDRRQKKKGAQPLKDPKEYFLSSVANNYADAPRRPVKEPPKQLAAEPQPAQTAYERVLEDIRAAWRAEKRAALRAAFYERPEHERDTFIEDITPQLKQNKVVWAAFKKSGYSKPLVENVLLDILFAQHHPAEPTPEELLRIGLEKGMLQSAQR